MGESGECWGAGAGWRRVAACGRRNCCEVLRHEGGAHVLQASHYEADDTCIIRHNRHKTEAQTHRGCCWQCSLQLGSAGERDYFLAVCRVDSKPVNTLPRPDIEGGGLSLLIKPQPDYLGCAVGRSWRPSTGPPRSRSGAAAAPGPCPL